MEKLICKECGKVFEYEKMSSCRAQLRVHIEKEHNMKLEDYIVKHEYGGGGNTQCARAVAGIN